MYVKDYLSDDEFEEWVYENDKLVEEEINCDLYLDMISTSYNNKEERITLKNKLKSFLEQNDKKNYDGINDMFIELVIEQKCDDKISRFLIQKYSRKEKIIMDFKGINTSGELQQYIKEHLQLSNFYGMNWVAFEDLLYCDIQLPYKIIVKNWSELMTNLPNDASTFMKLLVKYKKDCEILFI